MRFLLEKSKEQLRIKAAIQLAKNKDKLSWMDVSLDEMKGKFLNFPDRLIESSEINENLIIDCTQSKEENMEDKLNVLAPEVIKVDEVDKTT